MKTSLGLKDFQEIWFSAKTRQATIFTFSFFSSNSFIIQKVVQAQHISPFISYIKSPGFTWIHQVSKVTHFPTIQIVGNFLSTIFSKITILGFLLLHFQTASKSQSHSFFISSKSKTFTFTFLNFVFFTISENVSG